MKNVKKILSLLLAVTLVLAMSTAAFATSGTNDNTGSITINDAVSGQTYTIYQILALESYNTDSGAYAYKAADMWRDFIARETIKDIYVEVDDQGYVTWKSGADPAAFAKLAQAYAKSQKITNQGRTTASSATVSFTNLNLGYYLVDSTLGTLCALNTTAPNATIQEKNEAPTNEKTVQEDSTEIYGSVNDAEIGQTVNFKSTVTLPKGSENVVFHDAMTKGLTLNPDSIQVYTDADLQTALSADNYDLKTAGLSDPCTFEISFKETYLDSLTVNATLYVVYSAVLNSNAVVGGSGNTNTGKLSYGDAANTKSTPDSTTKTYTWEFAILKYGNGEKENVLPNAQFVLLNVDKTKVATIANGKLTGWETVPADGKTWPNGSVMITDADGKIAIAGLDAGTYYLRETNAPAGYNILSEDKECKIERAESSTTTSLAQKPLKAEINNQSGTVLPTTGGIGTTVFYVLGSLLMVGALVFLVVRKRMEAEA